MVSPSFFSASWCMPSVSRCASSMKRARISSARPEAGSMISLFSVIGAPSSRFFQKRCNIKDQGNLPVAEYGPSRNPRQFPQVVVYPLDDDLLLPQQPVYHNPPPLFSAADDHEIFRVPGGSMSKGKEAVEPDDRKEPVSKVY